MNFLSHLAYRRAIGHQILGLLGTENGVANPDATSDNQQPEERVALRVGLRQQAKNFKTIHFKYFPSHKHAQMGRQNRG